MTKCYCGRYATFSCCCWCGFPFDRCGCDDRSGILKCAQCYFQELHLSVPKTDQIPFQKFHVALESFKPLLQEYKRIAPKTLDQHILMGLLEHALSKFELN